MGLIRKFDIRVFIVLLVLTVGVDYFKDEDFNNADILYGALAAVIGTILWAIIKNKI